MAVARHVFVFLSVLVVVSWGLERCEATGKFSFEVHHMFSDAVKQTLGLDNLVPEKGSMEYFKVLAHRDQLIRGRGLASNNEKPSVTFMRENLTIGVDVLGSLHYANVSVGTPATWFFVALDTGSDLFWLPCNCGTTCIRDLKDIGLPQNQTGLFGEGIALNGLLGLGLEDYSVPSVLAKANITANSFSMCIGNVIDVIGRISFGDKGYTDQQETPLVPVGPSPTYAVDVTEVSVGGEALGIKLLALVDTGTSFTHLLEAEYDLVTKTFDDQVKDKRRPIDPKIPFEFCYDLSPNSTTIYFPKIIMTFGGGSQMILRNPLFSVFNEDGTAMYCLGILKSVNFKLNIFGQNFLSGYRIVFDRERMVLGWKRSNCYEDESLEATPPPPEIEAPSPRLSAPLPSPPPPPLVSIATPPPFDPRSSTGNGSGGAASLSPLSSQLLLLLSLLAFLSFT
uniref:Peptidase A1 domain-containing protein n=1 Tax=Brassica campestris TaxID=3711 RepID=M4D8P7_BRACM